MTVEPGTRALRPVGLSPAERSSDSLRFWGLRGLMRRCHSPLGLFTPGSRLSVLLPSESASRLVHCASPSCAPIQSATEAWSCRLALHWGDWAHATDPGDPEWPVDQRLGVLGLSGQDGTEARTRRLDPSRPTPPLAATRIQKLERVGWVRRAHATGRCHPKIVAQFGLKL